ncbi:hypothetical protein ACJIZ3_000960 [Penstemon smallii]|uniref:PsbP C-terminal domain-containing protein n=1 Tax=Penstemon smallii TaxID=265156 RepID=A0ABD3U2C3_9LAMI
MRFHLIPSHNYSPLRKYLSMAISFSSIANNQFHCNFITPSPEPTHRVHKMATSFITFQPPWTTSYSPKLNRTCLHRTVSNPSFSGNSTAAPSISCKLHESKDFAVPRRDAMALILSGFVFSQAGVQNIASAQTIEFREYIDTFDGYSVKYPKNWIQVRGAGADIFFRDPFVLDENMSVDISSPSSSRYKSVEDLGTPEEAGKKVLRQYLTEFMSTRLGVRRESSILSTSSRVASDGKLYYVVEANIKSYANNNELAVMPQERVARLEWDRRYFSVLGVENNRLYELRLQTPEKSFAEEENDLREVMDSFRVNKVSV